MRILKKILLLCARFLNKHLCIREFASQKYKNINERPNEYSFVLREIAKTQVKTIIDVGTGITSFPHLLYSCGYVVTAIDNVVDYWPKSMFNRHFHVINDDILQPVVVKGPYDAISCISVIEHIPNHRRVMRNLYNLLPVGGHCFCTFPFTADTYSPNVYAEPGSSVGTGQFPFVTQSFSHMELDMWMSDCEWVIAAQEYWRYFSGRFWTVGERYAIPLQVDPKSLHQLTCIHFVKKGTF